MLVWVSFHCGVGHSVGNGHSRTRIIASPHYVHIYTFLAELPAVSWRNNVNETHVTHVSGNSIHL